MPRDNLILTFLFIILILFGVWRLPYSPATWFDEGINLGIAKGLINHGVFSLEIAPGEFVETRQFLITSNYPVLLPAALSMKLFGLNLVAARAPMVLFLFLFALAAYFLVKKLYGKTAAIMSVALIVSFTPFYGNGKNVLGEIPGLFYFLCALLILGRTLADENSRRGRAPESARAGIRNFQMREFGQLFLAGLFIGLSAATKPFFLIVPAAVWAGEIACRRGDFKILLKRLLLVAFGAFPPLVFWFYTILPSFSLAGLFSAFNYYSNSYASVSFGGLIFTNFLRFFTESTPIHFLLLFVASAAFLIWNKKNGEKIKEAEIIFSVFILLALAFYLKTPGWYRYFFPAHMVLFLVFPAAALRLVGRKTAVFLIALLFIFQTSYTISQRNSSLYYSDEAEIFSEYVAETTAPDDKIFIINAPSAAFLIEGRQVYQYLQINPVLSFGKTDIENYNYVAVSGEGVDIFSDALKAGYKIQKQIGRYSLYRKLSQ
ncbi:MAG: glycosyltransferase family 39 protein [Candidatus Giovannonibacteria bacterium]|nr:MAG: glycosyltransferase family 39 protein [Candidatus Giovannonibacteria bacterium]